MAWGNFALQDGDSHGEHTDAETLDAAANDERGEVGHENLDEGGNEVYESSDPDGGASSEVVTDVGRGNG